jgi:hypothetical protein
MYQTAMDIEKSDYYGKLTCEQARANAASKPKGKLASQLEQQKKQTRSDTLDALSKDERRARDADAGAEARAFN